MSINTTNLSISSLNRKDNNNNQDNKKELQLSGLSGLSGLSTMMFNLKTAPLSNTALSIMNLCNDLGINTTTTTTTTANTSNNNNTNLFNYQFGSLSSSLPLMNNICKINNKIKKSGKLGASLSINKLGLNKLNTVKQQENVNDNKALVHHLWEGCNTWTSGKQDSIFYLDSNNNNNNNNGSRMLLQTLKAVLTVIEPNSLKNTNLLGHMDEITSNDKQDDFQNNKKSKRKNKRKKVGIFKEFVFFSHGATDALCNKLSKKTESLEFDSQNLYQFEARYFQYSVLRGNIRFVKDYRNNKEYLIFKFGTSSDIDIIFNTNDEELKEDEEDNSCGVDLYAICERNNRSNQQPWFCQHIFTLNEMLRFFKLNKSNNNVKNGFLNAMKIVSNCISKEFHTGYECKEDKIESILARGYTDYIDAKRQRDGINNNNNNDLASNGIIPSFESIDSRATGFPSAWGNSSLTPTLSNSSMGSVSSLGSILSLSSTGPQSSIESGYSSSTSNTSRTSRCSRSSKYSTKSTKSNNGNNNNQKIKNEDKFQFLEMICNELGLEKDYRYNDSLPRSLMNLLSESIQDAFKFAKLYPDTALTQAYIEEDNGKITFELVLLAEIKDTKNNKYYKFGVPITECSYKDLDGKSTGKFYYKAKNILTPKMVIDNVRLNTINAEFVKGTWIIDIENSNESFYQEIDESWYNEDSSNYNNEDDDSDSEDLSRPSTRCGSETFNFSSFLSGKRNSCDIFANDSQQQLKEKLCIEVDPEKFYQIGFNINSGGKRSFKRNNNNNSKYNRNNRNQRRKSRHQQRPRQQQFVQYAPEYHYEQQYNEYDNQYQYQHQQQQYHYYQQPMQQMQQFEQHYYYSQHQQQYY